MTTEKPPPSSLPHHRLIAYQLALSLVKLIAGIRIGDAQLRQQARKSAASAALNAAEGAARTSAGDKSRCYAIALVQQPGCSFRVLALVNVAVVLAGRGAAEGGGSA